MPFYMRYMRWPLAYNGHLLSDYVNVKCCLRTTRYLNIKRQDKFGYVKSYKAVPRRSRLNLFQLSMFPSFSFNLLVMLA